MALETGTYIDDLVATNPTSGDLKSQGDDHIRLIKATIKASFPNVAGAVTLTHGELSGVDTPLTGTPTAPTQSPADNSTAIATTAYVDASFVAAAYPPVSGNSGKFLTNDGNVTSWEDAYTEAECDAKFAPLNSPTLTGTPVAPTAAPDTSTTQIATTAFVTTEANLKADLASPTFTGTPLAPTATAGTDNTQIATTSFVATSFAPLASPALTGTPTAPTAALGTDTTQIATTAFVEAAEKGLYDAYVEVADVKATTTDGGSCSATTWNVRSIAEISDDSNIASVSANVLTLDAGTYDFIIFATAYDCGPTQLRLYDSVGASDVEVGLCTSAGSGDNTMNIAVGTAVIAGTEGLRIETYTTSAQATNGLGLASSSGKDEVYVKGVFRRRV